MDITNIHVTLIEGIYIISLAIGFLLSLLGLFLGGDHGDGDLGHAHGDVGHGHGDASSDHTNAQGSTQTASIFNMQAIFAFLLGFGTGGFVTYRLLGIVLVSIIIAILVGSICWLNVRKVVGALLKNQTKFLNVRPEDAIGVTGLITTKIHPNSLGEVMFPFKGSNNIIMARSDSSEPLEKGVPVVIMDVKDRVATVIPVDSLYD